MGGQRNTGFRLSMARIESFPPLVRGGARVLILGSMPGEASLRAGQYYAHPRNLFWRLMGEIYGPAVGPQQPYAQRTQALLAHGVAVWDVLGSCEREGSLDSAIRNDSIVVNDFSGFLQCWPTITQICFNGGLAERSFVRQVRPHLLAAGIALPALLRLPSSSPAHAAVSWADKLAAWQAALAG